jgi:hypothetical protein
MFNSDLISLMMGAPRILFEGDSGGAGGGSTVLTAGGSAGEGGEGGTGGAAGGDGGAGANGGDGGGKAFGDWRDQVSDDLKGSEFIKGYEGKTISDLVTEHIETKGKSEEAAKFAPPAENATDEQRATWLKERMTDAGYSIPESVEGYEIGEPDLPDGMYYNEDAAQGFLEDALDIGLPKHIVKELVDRSDARAINQHIQDIKDREKALSDSIDAMKKEYKDDYKKVVENSFRAAKAFGGDKLFKLLDEAKLDGQRLGDIPEIVETFNNVAKSIMEDTAGAQFKNGGPTDKTKENRDADGNIILSFPSME